MYCEMLQLGNKEIYVFVISQYLRHTKQAATPKLGISFFEYMHDRISQIENILPLGTIIREKSSSNPFGWSWILE